MHFKFERGFPVKNKTMAGR